LTRTVFVLAASLLAVQPIAAAESSWFSRFLLPVLKIFSYAPQPESLPLFLEEISPEPACFVAPLSTIEDESALAFEQLAGSQGVVDVDGLTPQTSFALMRFQQIVRSAGGSITMTSGYRPPAYQAHLQELWEKWMYELRTNTLAECQDLRTEVLLEFSRHGLMESQRPATTSDHTLGLAFDAVVLVPGRARRRIDLLARRAGLYRPVAAADPVHFRLAD
jgi:hypothetical protein